MTSDFIISFIRWYVLVIFVAWILGAILEWWRDLR